MNVFKFGFVFVCLVALGFAGCYTQEPSAKDRALMIEVGDFEVFDITLPENYAGYENHSRTLYFDGTLDLDYEFEIPDDDTTESSILYLSTTFAFEHKKSDAKINEMIQGGLSETIMEASGLKLAERNDLYAFGDKSRLFEIQSEAGDPVGNYFQAVKGTRYFTMYLVGVHLADRESWNLLLDEKFDRMERTKLKFFSLQHPEP